ncbi:MAG: hypothetical protein Q8909_04110 [Bacteroidota bacterium]|nr:hypothetical protein [Bacteroidota bacterium]
MKFNHDKIKIVFLLICCFSVENSLFALNDEQLLKIRDGYSERREQAFAQLKGKPLVVAKKSPPLEPGRALFTRSFSYSLVDFAFKALWLNEQIDVANSALVQNADYYIDNLPAMKDRDSFYWAADEWLRLLEYFGSKGSKKPGLITKETEEKLYKMMWQYNKVFSKIAKAEYKVSNTWFIDESENHHIQRFSTYWHFAKFLKNHPDYMNLKYDDGYTSQQHFEAWTIYIKHWTVERAKKGLFIEMANESYGLETLKGVYNFYDFGDKQMRSLTGKLLDLYWATWAEEQLGGVSGGSKNRVYPGKESKSGRGEFWKMAWYYLGIAKPTPPSHNLMTLIASDYRMPLVVMDIALDTKGRGIFEVKQRKLGLAVKGYYNSPDYRLRQDSGGLVRYSYCTPEFIIGTAHFEARKWQDWTLISSQNRWQGVIFAGDDNARIFPQCSLNDTYRTYNQHWSVQSKGCMITQKLPEGYARDGKPMRVFFSNAGLSNYQERNGWVFVESQEAYTALKCVSKGFNWLNDTDGKWLVCEDELTPIIMEVVRKADYQNYTAFQEKILNSPLKIAGKKLTYHSTYGDDIVFNGDYSTLSTINGKIIDLQPDLVYDSPFINSVWDSGKIKISKDGRYLNLDFTEKI